MSNHFVEGKPSKDYPNPTLFLTISTNTASTPKKKKKKRKQPFPRLRKKFNAEKPCSSNNFDDTEGFESNMAEPLIKDKQ